MSLENEVARLLEENKRLSQENSRLRAQLHFLSEDVPELRDKATARRLIANGIGQCFCPRCHTIVWEPPNIPDYWRSCQYANKEPPEYCPACGQHLARTGNNPTPQFEEDPLKNQYKGDKKNGNWHYRR